MSRTPPYAYAVAIVLGILSALTPANLPLESPSLLTALLISTVIFGVAGFILAVPWPSRGWKWGIWIVAPGLLLVTLGVLTTGDVSSFLGDDLPFLATGLLGASVGGGTGARLRGRSKAST